MRASSRTSRVSASLIPRRFRSCDSSGNRLRFGLRSQTNSRKPRRRAASWLTFGTGPPNTRAGPREQALVAFFGSRFVASDLALGALVEATAASFPSVTIECGRAGDPAADRLALAGLRALLETDELASGETHPIQLFGDPVRVCLRDGARLRFGAGPVDSVEVAAVPMDRVVSSGCFPS